MIHMLEYRVFGPPGTGKTTWISRRIGEIVQKYDLDKIFVCSFTRAAAQELAGRDLPIPTANMGTIHALCYRARETSPCAEIPASLKVWNNLHPTPTWQIGRDPTPDDPQVGVGLELATWNYMRNTQEHPIPTQFAVAWTKFKEEQGSVDFTDMLLDAPDDLGADVLFVDEAQDLTPLQWRIVRQWGSHAKVFVVVGDDDQLLYSFLGADVSTFLAPLPEDHKRILHHSYRCPRAVSSTAQRWIAQLEGRREPKKFDPRDAEGECRHRSYTLLDPTKLLADAADRAASGLSVLFLTQCAYMLAPLLSAMRTKGMTYSNPYRPDRADWNPLRATAERMLGHLACWDAWDEHREPTASDWYDWIKLVDAKHLRRRGFKTDLKRRAEDKLPALVNPLADFDDELLAACGDLGRLVPLMTAAGRKACKYPLRVWQRSGEDGLRGPHRLQVGTIHSVKGGEADVVYLFPDISAQAAQNIEDNPRPAKDALCRQVYVGMTRARESLFLCESSSRCSHAWEGKG